MLANCLGIVGVSMSMAWLQTSPPEAISLVKDLSHPDFERRETASWQLVEFGPRALAAVREASQSDDPEAAERAKIVEAQLFSRALTKQLLAPNYLNLSLANAGLHTTIAELDRITKRTIPLDPRILPQQATLSMKGQFAFWEVIEAIENKFKLSFEMENAKPIWRALSTDTAQQRVKLGGFRLRATVLPFRERYLDWPLMLTLDPDLEREVVRIQAVEVKSIRSDSDDEIITKDPILPPDLLDPTQMRNVRGGRVVFGRNGLEVYPEQDVPVLTRQQVILPLIWPERSGIIAELAGELRASVRGQPKKVCEVEQILSEPQTAQADLVRLKVARPRFANDRSATITIGVNYPPNLLAFPQNETMNTDDDETTLINGRARVILRGQGGVVINGTRFGLNERMAYHGIRVFSDRGLLLPLELFASSVNFSSDGIVVEEFMFRVPGQAIESLGPPDRVRLVASGTHTITIPFIVNNLTR